MFFTGCNLHCCYCQNYEISCLNKGKEISVARLKEIYHELIDKGVHNIDLVTPTHFAYSILQSLDEKLPVPVVYNSSGFEATDTLLKFEGKVQIWLPDLKYSDDTLALKYSNAYDYWNISRKAIQEMFRQVGPYRLDADGIMKSGVIIRHLVLPCQRIPGTEPEGNTGRIQRSGRLSLRQRYRRRVRAGRRIGLRRVYSLL